ncbi:3'-5' exonuclease [Paenibacillus sp. H1-7]|uniref:3'-5' exonuclease n=1 Tax=Paenibacillus sp. H1-7 TaxID=2282849 RepID=UPI001EF9AF8D|nr:3'-5' exonuclease [Paenibacillus sp. H1-7]ULL16126.1 3'-5' exonuclease [Paenibacillus sp. H1-7]
MNISFLSKDEYLVQDVLVRDLLNSTFVVFDLEGTGIDFATESITQIGAVKVENGTIHAAAPFESLVQSSKPIPAAIEELTGISNQEMADAPKFPEVYKRFVEFIGDAVLVTQAGYEYDVPMLQKYCETYNAPPLTNTVLDTKVLFANLHRDVQDVISTDFLIRYYHIQTSDLKRHDALDDCILIGRILLGILNEYKEKSISSLHIDGDGLRVKRFIIPAIYLNENNSHTDSTV